jgi:periplasmic divalent cation tolerance protein
MTDKRVVLSTAGSQEEARKIAQHLVENHLAACVNIVPQITSVYRWQEQLAEASEWLLLIKTRERNFDRVRDAIQKLHSYEMPECICLTVEDGTANYLRWIEESIV